MEDLAQEIADAEAEKQKAADAAYNAEMEAQVERQTEELKQMTEFAAEEMRTGLEQQAQAVRDSTEEQIAAGKRRIEKIDGRLKQIAEQRRRTAYGQNAENGGGGSGINGQNRYDGYQYTPDKNGNLDPGEIARAERMAQGADRDAESRTMGPNARKRYEDRLAELNGKDDRKLSQRERRERNNLRRWKDQENEGKLKDQKDKEEKRLADLNKKSGETLKEIKDKLEMLGLK